MLPFFCLAANLLQCTSTYTCMYLLTKNYSSTLISDNNSLHVFIASTIIRNSESCKVQRVDSQFSFFKTRHRWQQSRLLVSSTVISYVSFVVMYSCTQNSDIYQGLQYTHNKVISENDWCASGAVAL